MINAAEEIKKIESSCGKINPVLKAALSADGSLTVLLSAVFGDISVKIKSQETKEDFIFRSVVIYSGKTPLLFAESSAQTGDLSGGFKKDLSDTDLGIGRLIGKYALETRREIVKMGVEPQNRILREIFGESLFLNKEYKIICGAKPLFCIKEIFCANAFPGCCA
jgi:chorismate-pyruvate lyase